MRRTLSLALLALVLLAPTYSIAGEPAKDAPAPVEVEKAAPAAETPAPAEEKKAEEPVKKAEEAKVVEPIPEPTDIGEAVEDIGLMIEAAKNGNWVLFAGILILLLIFLLDKVINLKQYLPKKAVPWVAAGFGVIVSIAMQLTTGIPWGQALLQGLCAGLVATGFWELVFQHIDKKKSAE